MTRVYEGVRGGGWGYGVGGGKRAGRESGAEPYLPLSDTDCSFVGSDSVFRSILEAARAAFLAPWAASTSGSEARALPLTLLVNEDALPKGINVARWLGMDC